MINKHCGTRLRKLYGSEPTYTEDCTTKKRTPLRHTWICHLPEEVHPEHSCRT
jgi:hypothetical protein